MSENKRFTEIISIQKVIDNQTGKEYDCLIDDDLLILLNELGNENEQLKHELHTLTGLYAFDKLGDGVKASDDVITIPRKDLIKLDYGDV